MFGSKVRIENVGFNPTRTGLFQILKRMGAAIEVKNERMAGGEEIVDLHVEHAALRGIDLDANDVVLAIDEIPILAVAAAFAEGITNISGAAELRVKESDRLKMTAELLGSFGVEVVELPDGLRIVGKPSLAEGERSAAGECNKENILWKTSGDHRISMSAAVMEYAVHGRLRFGRSGSGRGHLFRHLSSVFSDLLGSGPCFFEYTANSRGKVFLLDYHN